MSSRTLYFISQLGFMLGGSTLALYLLFGDWFHYHWDNDPFGFWIVSGAIIALACGGAAQRALTSYHPRSAEARKAS